MSEVIKEYSTNNVTIIWKPDVCIHSAVCVKNLQKVFRPKEKPWIDVTQATDDDLIATVKKCPSGALDYKIINNKVNVMEENQKVEITVRKNGPLLINGSVKLMDPEGNEIETKEKFSLCRCSHSSRKPFCDGTHKTIEPFDEI